MTDLNFTVSEVIPLLVRPDAIGPKVTTIRLAAKWKSLKVGDILCLRDERQLPGRVIGTVPVAEIGRLQLGDMNWWRMLDEDSGEWRNMPDLAVDEMAILDGFRGASPGGRLTRVLEGIYIHGKRMPYPLDLVIIHWRHEDLVLDPDYTLPGEQLEMPR